mgnify:FL=1
MADRINFSKNINTSVQVGDKLYYSYITPNIQPTLTEIGEITAIGSNFVEVASNTAPAFVNNETFFMFKKPFYNNESVKGYFAKTRLSADTNRKIELFAIGSEVTQSSK